MTGHDEHEIEYDDNFVHALELVWGEGFLSPGGADEVAKALEGVDIAGKSVIDRAVARAEREGLSDRITFLKVKPGPFPLDDESFDVVFSKDAMIHIPDKAALFAEVYRVLRPGGLFSGSDWMRGNEEPATPELKRWLEIVGLTFELESQERYKAALENAGFENVTLLDRRDWAREVLRDDYEQLAQAKHEALRAGVGDEADKYVKIWHAAWQTAVVGQLAPGHLRGFKPAG